MFKYLKEDMNSCLKEDNEKTCKQLSKMKLEMKNSGNQTKASEENMTNKLQLMSDLKDEGDEIDYSS